MKKLFIILCLAICSLFSLQAVDIWQYPEAAEQNAVFLDVRSPYISFTRGFEFLPPWFGVDYLLPIGLPFSLGVYFKTPSPNLKSFGARAGYHINLDDPKTDLYVLYVFDLGFLRNETLIQYNDEEQQRYFYDFRFGIRRLINKYLCLSLESDHKLNGFIFGISIKLL